MSETNINDRNEIIWQSIREKWTVKLAMGIIVVVLAVVIIILGYSVYQDDATLVDKILTIFNAITMAILGYLFGYVPAKSSEESIQEDRKALVEQYKELEQVITDYETTIEIQEEAIKEYELIIAMYEEE